MNWILWVCIAHATSGLCTTERKWLATDLKACSAMKDAIRVEPQHGNVSFNSTQATAIDTTIAPQPSGTKVVIACVQEPKV